MALNDIDKSFMGLPADVKSGNKLVMIAYSDLTEKGDGKDQVGYFETMFNPTSYNRKFELEYTQEQPRGTIGTPEVYRGSKPEELTFSFLIDGTGVSGQKVSGEHDKKSGKLMEGDKVNVDAAVLLFTRVATGYLGEKHRPPFLKIFWGSLDIICIAKSVEVSYDLFNKDGSALRATINIAVSTTSTLEGYKALENKSSPDLTHVREVGEGESLPLMTRNIYGDDAYYLEVAKANDLNHFRQLKPGSKLFFPPLSK